MPLGSVAEKSDRSMSRWAGAQGEARGRGGQGMRGRKVLCARLHTHAHDVGVGAGGAGGGRAGEGGRCGVCGRGPSVVNRGDEGGGVEHGEVGEMGFKPI